MIIIMIEQKLLIINILLQFITKNYQFIYSKKKKKKLTIFIFIKIISKPNKFFKI